LQRRPANRWLRSGQSLVEFTLVITILLVLVIGVADFGRIFAAGVVLETAARDAAEVAAQEYLSDPPSDLGAGAAPADPEAYYGNLHDRAGKVACAETRELPSVDYDSTDQTCKTWPVVRVCVHDDVDVKCGEPISGFAASIPSECADLKAAVGGVDANGWAPTKSSDPLLAGERWVEVRVCYKFSALLNAPIFSLGDFYLERQRQFVIPCYFALGTNACG
jgi:hypothetical protein